MTNAPELGQRRKLNWLHINTVLSAAVLIGAEVFGAAYAGGWAIAMLLGLGDLGIISLRVLFFAAGLAVAARAGVNVSAGWQLSQVVEYNSTLMSVKQVTIDHTHYETVDGCWAATELYGRVFKPTVHKEIYAFEDLPRAFQEMQQNVQTGIPIVRVAKQMPEAVKRLV